MSLAGYIARRLLWMLPSLLGITLVSFLLMDLAPSDRAELGGVGGNDLVVKSNAELQALREHWGLIDPDTKEPYSIWQRYASWLGRACTFDLVGPGDDPVEFHARIARALPVTVLVNVLALLLSLVIGIPLGVRLGMAPDGLLGRVASGVLFVAFGLPEFVLATLLLLAFGGGWFEPLLPSSGLWTEARPMSAWHQAWDMAQHLILPVCTLAVAPCIFVARFLRVSVGQARQSDFALALRGWGMDEACVRRAAARNGLSPLVTLMGAMLAGLVGGSVIVENVFTIPGLGQLAYHAMRNQEYAMVMAMTLLVSVVTLVSLLLSDILHRLVDPRVELR